MDIIPAAPVRIDFFGLPMHFNVVTLLNSWLVMAVLILLAWRATRSLTRVPGRLQASCELVIEFFGDICVSTLGGPRGRAYMPFIGTIFLFVLVSNVIGIVPNFLGAAGWPGFVCPTQDVNTPLALALITVVVVHASAIRIKGFRSWLWSFYEPSFPGDIRATKALGALSFIGGIVLYYVFLKGYLRGFDGFSVAQRLVLGLLVFLLFMNLLLVTIYAFQLGRVPNVLMAPLNFVGELGKAISHPFRLFGNIFGGFVILTVALSFTQQFALPSSLKTPFALLGIGGHLVLSGFFGVLIGLVQAFVFAMLALAYIAVQISED